MLYHRKRITTRTEPRSLSLPNPFIYLAAFSSSGFPIFARKVLEGLLPTLSLIDLQFKLPLKPYSNKENSRIGSTQNKIPSLRRGKMRKLSYAIGGLGKLVILFAWASTLWASEFPTKPINLLVGYAAGGVSDVQARSLASAAEPFFGQPVIVSNKPGATGTVMMTLLANSKPDGYTVALTPGSVAIAPFFHKVPYDLTRDFTHLVGICTMQEGITVRADSPWMTLKEVVEFARKNPNQVKIGVAGLAVSITIIAENIGKQAGVQWTIVPFKSESEAGTALLGGHVNVATLSGATVPLVRAGKLRLLATATPTRLKEFPDVPTLQELGFDYVTLTLCGILAPKGLPEPIAQKLEEVFAKARNGPAFQETMKNLSLIPELSTGKDFERRMIEHYRKIKDYLGK